MKARLRVGHMSEKGFLQAGSIVDADKWMLEKGIAEPLEEDSKNESAGAIQSPQNKAAKVVNTKGVK